MKLLICLILILLTGCQSRVSIVFDPNSGYFEYEREGDIEVTDFEATLPDQTVLKFGGSKSENLAYREGILAAKETINNALDKIIGGK